LKADGEHKAYDKGYYSLNGVFYKLSAEISTEKRCSLREVFLSKHRLVADVNGFIYGKLEFEMFMDVVNMRRIHRTPHLAKPTRAVFLTTLLGEPLHPQSWRADLPSK
jgi:hypothetical protein